MLYLQKQYVAFMNKTLFTLIFFAIISYGYAQQYATTTNGDKVILRDNKTWSYVNEKAGETTSTRKSFISQSSTKNNSQKSSKNKKKNSSTSRKYITGPRGGCYYINSNGNKVYVDRSLCN